ncbi:hypothetical protein AMECASPLE_005677 [Ameca splendens]|uniref:Uncharacterized protein n=1 Tax=Ameca splendens TaxID=208324 RepID=A0ABV0XC82_9TELE
MPYMIDPAASGVQGPRLPRCHDVRASNQHKRTKTLQFTILRHINMVLPAETHKEDAKEGCVIMVRLIVSDKCTLGAGGLGLGVCHM